MLWTNREENGTEASRDRVEDTVKTRGRRAEDEAGEGHVC